MTRLGFYIIHNMRYKMVCSIDIPWNFETNTEDAEIPMGPIIGEWDGPQGELPEDNETKEDENAGIALMSDESEPIEPPVEEPAEKETFEEWFERYYNLVLSKDSNFTNKFNHDRTYVIIAFDKEDVMGLFNMHKGWTYINFNEFDYRVIINELFPTIRETMIFKDDSFGGYDEDGQFAVDNPEDKLHCDCEEDNCEHKTLATYPNLIYHICIGHFDHPHYHKS